MTDLHLRAMVDDRGFDIEFAIGAGEVLAVLGPNGAGKTTALHVIAGLVRPDSGVVRLGDRVLTDTSAGVFVPTHARRVGLLLQEALLFPHLNVAANVAFAPRSGHRRRPRRAARATAAHWLAQVDAADLADRMPRQLSGGQAQRVALARALAASPDVLLLDEPLAGLDVATATAMRKLLRNTLNRDGQVRGADNPRSARRVDPCRPRTDPGVRQDRRNRFGGIGIGRTSQPFRRAVRRGEPCQRHRRAGRRAEHRVGRRLARQPRAGSSGRPARRGAVLVLPPSPCIATSRTAARGTWSR